MGGPLSDWKTLQKHSERRASRLSLRRGRRYSPVHWFGAATCFRQAHCVERDRRCTHSALQKDNFLHWLARPSCWWPWHECFPSNPSGDSVSPTSPDSDHGTPCIVDHSNCR